MAPEVHPMNRTLATSALLTLILALTGPAVAAEFTLVALPDTQKYSENFPRVYNKQTHWIAHNREAWNIQAFHRALKAQSAL